ncbi:agamous-like MADS-box protein AGL29 [Panicum miliaceum]|uniref:Agamous-like MADS-box protein AGL29 n=1 Tax=Panicum miliaceum TaxID=4540 RepID=A0A3L6Q5N9_PANMI|nr:agamous-like MADS-box protein AGL29 [Panicum miliaceum]
MAGPNMKKYPGEKYDIVFSRMACSIIISTGSDDDDDVPTLSNKQAFSFGHPSVESILDRFLDSSPGAGAGLSSAGDRAISELNRQYGELRAQLDAEKARQECADETIGKERAARSQAMVWVDADLSAMGHDDLVAFWGALIGVQAAVAASADQLLRDALLVGRRGRQPAQLTFDVAAFGVSMQPPPGFAGVDLQGFGGQATILAPSF